MSNRGARTRRFLSAYPFKELFLLFLLFFVITLIVFFAVELYVAYKNHFFRVREIYVTGDRFVRRSFILNKLGIRTGEPIFSCDIRGAEYRLMSTGLFKRVYTSKVYPYLIVVKLKEKVPLMRFLWNSRWYVVASDGSLLTNYRKKPWYLVFDADALVRLIVSGIPSKYQLKKAVFYYEKLDKLGKINYIKIEKRDYEVFHFNNGLNVRVNLIDCGEDSVILLGRVWRHLSEIADRIKSVNICLGNKIAVKWKEGVKK